MWTHKILLIVASVPLVVMACASPSTTTSGGETGAPAPAVKKRIVAGLRGDPPNFSQQLSRSGAGRIYGSTEVEALLNSGLQVLDNRQELRPVLVEAIPSVENGLWQVLPDGSMVTTWKIKPNVFWHDGAPFTSADLLFTSMVVMDPELPDWKVVEYQEIESVAAPDPATIVVNWKRPFITANQLFMGTAALPQPKHLLEKTYLEDKANYNASPHFSDAYVGTGPYRMREFTRSSHAILDANDRFVLGRPKIDEIEVKFVQDSRVLGTNILSGHIDLILSGSSLTLDEAAQILERWDGTSEATLSGTVGAFPQFIDPNPRVILDVGFRRALYHAIDRQLLVDNLQYGLTKVAHTNMVLDNPEYKHVESRLVTYPHDPRRSVQLIEGLGYALGADGIFRNAANQPLKVELRSTPGREVNERATLAVADMWHRVGVEVDILVLTLAQNSDREFRQTRPGFEVVGQPEDIYRFHTRQVPTAETRYVGDNRMRYSNAQLDQLVDRYYVTIPERERAEILGQMYHHITDQVVLMPFFYEAVQRLQAKKLINFTSPLGWNAYEWDVAP
jgi:peptide/nickel transport system substrate-binding protein